MARIQVVPASPAEPGRWKVEKNGIDVSNGHRKKTAAERKARRLADAGDTLQIHNRDGKIRDKVTVR